MGLHCGYIVASASAADLLEELSRHAGEFTVGTVVEHTKDAEIDSGEFDMLLGERDGRAFMVDTSMILSDSPDMLVAMSASLGTVIGCGAETVSGTYWLTAARDGEPLRFVFASHAATTRGMATGDPLSSEDEYPIEDVSGGGVFAAMASFDLDPRPWLRSGPATVVKFDYSRSPESGSIDEVRREHCERYARPTDDRPREIFVVEGRSS